jgi:hypothetical protein
MEQSNALPGTGPIPTLLALLVCESVIHDAETQKKTLVGLFGKLSAFALPVLINSIGLYAKLVEGAGKYAFKIRVVSLADESVLFEISQMGDWVQPELPLEFGVNIRGLPINSFGDYEFQLFANDIYLGRTVFSVDKLTLPLAPPPGPGEG